jgi:hypothetical protein
MQLVMKESYLVGMNASHYHLPYGVYIADAQDSRGIYYKAPFPIKISGLATLTHGELAQGGIYVPNSSTGRALGLWFYLVDEHGQVTADLIPGSLSGDEGNSWRVEPVSAAEPATQ